MKAHVYGTGCAKCDTLAENVRAAAAELGLDVEVEKVGSVAAIAAAGILLTPALAIDGRLRSSGRLLSVDEIKALLREDEAR